MKLKFKKSLPACHRGIWWTRCPCRSWGTESSWRGRCSIRKDVSARDASRRRSTMTLPRRFGWRSDAGTSCCRDDRVSDTATFRIRPKRFLRTPPKLLFRFPLWSWPTNERGSCKDVSWLLPDSQRLRPKPIRSISSWSWIGQPISAHRTRIRPLLLTPLWHRPCCKKIKKFRIEIGWSSETSNKLKITNIRTKSRCWNGSKVQ